jgi:hypothetical protein
LRRRHRRCRQLPSLSSSYPVAPSPVAPSPSSSHCAFAIIVDNGAHRRTKVAVDGVFFWLTGVGGDGRRHAANDGGGDVQQTTAETTRSEQRRGGSGDGGGVRRGVQCGCVRRHAANDDGGNMQRTTAETTRSERRRGGSGDGGVRWRRRSSGLVSVGGERFSFIFSFVSANCRCHEMLKP